MLRTTPWRSFGSLVLLTALVLAPLWAWVGGQPAASGILGEVADQGHALSGSMSRLVHSTVVGKLVANISVDPGSYPPVYDPFNGDVYLADYLNLNVSVVSGTSVLASFRLPGNVSYAMDPVVDPSTGYVYVSDSNFHIDIISGGAILSSVLTRTSYGFGVYDSSDGDVYYTGELSQSVAVLHGTTLVGAVYFRDYPYHLAYDSGNGYVYVQGSRNLTVISGTSIVATIPVDPSAAGGLGGVAYDPVNGDVYDVRGDSAGGNVTVIQGTHMIGSVRLGPYPGVPAADPANGLVYVVSGLRGNATVISGTTLVQNLSGFAGGTSFDFDAADGYEFASTRNATALNGTTIVGNVTIPWGGGGTIGYDTANGDLYAAEGCGFPPCTIGKLALISTQTPVGPSSCWAAAASIPVGGGPAGAAFDLAKGEVFVTNGYLSSDNLSVISDASNTVVATIPVGTNPFGVAYDSARGEAFVANTGSHNVSIIADATNVVVATVAVGSNPYGTAYDSAKGEIFVTNDLSNNVSVISDSTNAVVATVRVGTNPWGAAYDSAKGEVFVANFNSQNVSVISDVTNTVVATVPVGYFPEGLVYDSAKGEVFAANYGSGNVSVISDVTNSVIAAPPIGSAAWGVAYDPADGQVFVTSYGSTTVSVISDATNAVVDTVNVGSAPEGAAYDSGKGEVFVSNSASNNVSVLAHGACAGPIISTFGASPATVQVGWTTYLNVSTSGGTGTLSHAYSGLPPGCASANVASLACRPTSSGTFSPRVYVNDTASHSATQATTLVVNAAAGGPSISSFTASPSPIQVGWTTYLNVSTSGGTAPLAYAFTGLPSGCGTSNVVSLTCTPTATGTFTVRVYVNDSASRSATSTATLTVNPTFGPTLASVSINPSNATIARGGYVAFTGAPVCNGGACPSTVAYSWSLRYPIAASLNTTTGPTVAFLDSGFVGPETLFLNATLNGVTKGATAAITVTSLPIPWLSSVSVSPAWSNLSAGASQAFAASVTCAGGSCPAGAAFAWVLSVSLGPLSSATGASTTFTAGSSSGTATLTVMATLNGVSRSANATITISMPQSAPPTFLGLPQTEGYVLLGALAIGVVLALLAVVLLARRKRKQGEPAAYAPGGPSPPQYPPGYDPGYVPQGPPQYSPYPPQ